MVFILLFRLRNEERVVCFLNQLSLLYLRGPRALDVISCTANDVFLLNKNTLAVTARV